MIRDPFQPALALTPRAGSFSDARFGVEHDDLRAGLIIVRIQILWLNQPNPHHADPQSQEQKMARELLITSVDDIKSKSVCGEQITILANSSQTGSYEIYRHDAPEGAGPPPHCHQWDEAFYVIEGVVDFNCGGIERSVGAGGFVHVPGGTIHSFRYASPTAQILGITSQGGAATMFTAVDRECGINPEIDKLLSVLGQNGVTVVA